MALTAFENGVRRLHSGDLLGAEVNFLRSLEGTGDGVAPAAARHNLAAAYLRQAREAEAEGQLRQVLRERPGFVASLQESGGIAGRRRRWAEVRDLAVALEKTGAEMAAAELRRRYPTAGQSLMHSAQA